MLLSSFYPENYDFIFFFSTAPKMMTVKSSQQISNWNFENGYERGVKSDEYPHRVFNAKAALYIAMKLYVEDINYGCVGPIQGFKVSLTLPGDTEKVSERYFQILTSEQADILIKPKLTTTSKKLRRYSPNQRQCFFDSDRKLRFFKMYTQNNCEAECLANFTQIECGCVKFSSPSTKSTFI